MMRLRRGMTLVAVGLAGAALSLPAAPGVALEPVSDELTLLGFSAPDVVVSEGDRFTRPRKIVVSATFNTPAGRTSADLSELYVTLQKCQTSSDGFGQTCAVIEVADLGGAASMDHPYDVTLAGDTVTVWARLDRNVWGLPYHSEALYASQHPGVFVLRAGTRWREDEPGQANQFFSGASVTFLRESRLTARKNLRGKGMALYGRLTSLRYRSDSAEFVTNRLGGRKVAVWFNPSGPPTARKIATVTTNSKGRYSVRVPQRSGTYWTKWYGDKRHAGDRSPKRRV